MITEILKSRFYQNMTRHPDLEWDLVEARLNENKEVLEVLKRMEESGGEPDAIGIDESSGKTFSAIAQAKLPPAAEAFAMMMKLWKSEKRTRLWAAPCISLKRWVYTC